MEGSSFKWDNIYNCGRRTCRKLWWIKCT